MGSAGLDCSCRSSPGYSGRCTSKSTWTSISPIHIVHDELPLYQTRKYSMRRPPQQKLAQGGMVVTAHLFSSLARRASISSARRRMSGRYGVFPFNSPNISMDLVPILSIPSKSSRRPHSPVPSEPTVPDRSKVSLSLHRPINRLPE